MGDRPKDEQDPFEDLDQFFASTEDEDDWLEGEGDLPAGAPEAAEAGAGAGAEGQPENALAGLDDIAIDVPEEDELLAERAAALEDDETGEPAAAPAGQPPPPEGGVPAAPEWNLETAEMAGEEWDRLRAEALAASGGEEAAEQPEGELSLDDLSSAPPQYADLPGPGATPDEPSGPVLEDPISGTGADDADEGVFGPEDTGEQLVPDAGAIASDEEPAEEPEPEAVEAAADHFATGMRPDEVERELLSDLGEGGGPETVRIEPTAPVVTEEPTWEEAAEAVEHAEPAPAAPAEVGARNITAALVSGGLLGAAVIALLAIGKAPFVVLATAAVLLAQAEFYAVLRTRGFQPATLLGLVCGGITFVGAYLQGEGAVLLGLVLAMGLTVPWYMALSQSARRHILANSGATILGVVYVPTMGSFAMLLLGTPGDAGRNLFLVVLGVTVLYDVCAYAVGTIWGNRPLAPTISPHKSWEGALGATLAVLLIGLSIIPNIDPFTAGTGVGLALLISLVGPLGDLVESALKRDLGVKDMGSLLPGHGGMLDRIDAVLFAMPTAYFFLRIVL
ncbi:MAG: phosphatidate cytidylyltransferase [Actinomycetota bacterium]|nr:phosphatidate cytidylyltransferase [Actinomycetota bacterium]